ncbi:MAG TPA: hypothetical protein PK919_11565 [Candidatus Aminicenantes bacterium]|nr:hypothetical protein [Candidatus Aminicenantes bacterium]
MILKSHMISMLVLAFFVALVLAFVRHSEPRRVGRYALKVFLTMAGGVVAFSWLMRFL